LVSPSGQELLGVISLRMGLPRILQPNPEIKRTAAAIGLSASDAYVSAEGCEQRFHARQARQRIAASAAGRRRGSGRAGRRSNNTERRRQANRSAMVKGGATGSASKAGKHQSQRQLMSHEAVITTEHFFSDHSCDRPGCYERIRAAAGEVSWQRFCSHACRRALETRPERERVARGTRLNPTY